MGLSTAVEVGGGGIGFRLFRKIVKANKLEKMERVAKKRHGGMCLANQQGVKMAKLTGKGYP